MQKVKDEFVILNSQHQKTDEKNSESEAAGGN
jgi:hypothetical protein